MTRNLLGANGASPARAALLAGALALALTVPARAQFERLGDLSAALANASAPIAVSTITTVQLIAAPTGLEPNGVTVQQILVTALDVIAAAAQTVQFVYGTGTNCATGQQPLTGVLTLGTGIPIMKGSGFGPVLVVPAGNAVCITTTAAVVTGGSIAYRVK